ncbi:MAG: ABC transporter permease [Thermoprotei archaeon]|nr:ABC transporter permease [Thermoprotei archaeon]
MKPLQSSRIGQYLERNRAKIEEWKLTLKVLLRSPSAVCGLVLVLLFLFMAVFGPYISPSDPYKIDFAKRLRPPSSGNPFGTDEYGRDLLSRVLHGARVSLIVGIVTLAICVPVGVVLGLIAGYFGGVVDEVIMRVTDIFLAFPALVLAMALSVAMGSGLMTVMIALAVVWWPAYVRITRGQVLSVRENLFIEAAKAMGISDFWIIARHILPNVLSPIIVIATMDMGAVILTAAALSFIGLGAQPPTPEWGRLVADGQPYFPECWWYVFFPGIAIFLTVLGFNLLGDGIRDALDPKIRRRLEFKSAEGESQ